MVTGALEPEEGAEAVLVWKKEHQGSQAWDKVDLRTPVQGAVEKSPMLEAGWGGAPTLPTVEEVAGLAWEREANVELNNFEEEKIEKFSLLLTAF